MTGLITRDGQPPQSVFILGVLRGNEVSPYFPATSTAANFALDSLAPGVYDVTIFASNYIPVTISDVQVGAGQAVSLGLVNLSPVDPLVPLAALALKAYLQQVVQYVVYTEGFNSRGISSQLQQLVNDYFSGPGVATVLPVPADPNGDLVYIPSSVPNPTVVFNNIQDLVAFGANPETQQAVAKTLRQIGANLQALLGDNLQTLPQAIPELQDARDYLQTADCNAPPFDATLDVEELMPALGLGNWMDVTLDPTSQYGPSPDPVLKMWEYTNGELPSAIAGGVGKGGNPPFNATSPSGQTTYDDRILSGTVKLVIFPNGSAYLSSNDLSVTLDDTFDFNPGGFGPLFNNGTAAGGLNIEQYFPCLRGRGR